MEWGYDCTEQQGRKLVRRLIDGTGNHNDLNDAFMWATTPDGAEYWHCMYMRLADWKKLTRKAKDKLLTYLLIY